MNDTTFHELCILFADIAGSVELYERIGDAEAFRSVSDSLKFMTDQVQGHGGRVVDIIGDEIMCMFEDTDNALSAACTIQKQMLSGFHEGMHVRIGIHTGQTGIRDGRPFGDTVNVAARVVAQAEAGQVMLTEAAQQRLSDAGRSRTKYFTRVFVKGKQEPCTIYQAFTDSEQGTVFLRHNRERPAERRSRPCGYVLCYQGVEVPVREGAEVLLGRGEQCELRVASRAASRIHAVVKCHAGSLIVTDRSTNGTYVQARPGRRSGDGAELYIHHDEWVTTSGGVLSPGAPLSGKETENISILCA